MCPAQKVNRRYWILRGLRRFAANWEPGVKPSLSVICMSDGNLSRVLRVIILVNVIRFRQKTTIDAAKSQIISDPARMIDNEYNENGKERE